jgi:hypothetical protein
MRVTLALITALALAAARAEAAYRRCHESDFYDGCECRGYVPGSDQIVVPSTHPAKAELCNLINLQTAFEYAVDGTGSGLTISLIRGSRYPLSAPVYRFDGRDVVEVVNDGRIRAMAHGQRWTSVGPGPYPVVSLPPFRGYDEHKPSGCQGEPAEQERKSEEPRRPPNPRDPRDPRIPPCRRFPKHQIGLFDATGYRVSIEYLELDGGLDAACAPRMPPFPGARRDHERHGLVALGWSAESSGTVFHDNVVRNVVGWTALHLGEGKLSTAGVPSCRGVEVYGNTFENLGYNLCDPVTDEAGVPRECYWGDAISMACTGSVRNNRIRNPTDVGIVAFVGGVVIEDNLISSDRSKAFGGIAAVDEFRREDGTWVANHDATVIAGNTIRADPGGGFDVGIGLGSLTWTCAARALPTFASSLVIANRIEAAGGRINYGLAVTLADGVESDGLRVGSARVCGRAGCVDAPLPNTFVGMFGGGPPGFGCAGQPAGPPYPYIVNSCSRCWLQEGYVRGPDYRHLLHGVAPANPPTCR